MLVANFDPKPMTSGLQTAGILVGLDCTDCRAAAHACLSMRD
jgi:hypothetical protein